MRLDLRRTQELGVDQAGDSEHLSFVKAIIFRCQLGRVGTDYAKRGGARMRFCGVVALRSRVNKPYYAGANQDFLCYRRALLTKSESES
jgi:hypothetical protein